MKRDRPTEIRIALPICIVLRRRITSDPSNLYSSSSSILNIIDGLAVCLSGNDRVSKVINIKNYITYKRVFIKTQRTSFDYTLSNNKHL